MMPDPNQFVTIVGEHPSSPNPFGIRFYHKDGHSNHGIPTRLLSETDSDVDQFVSVMRSWLRTHHSRPEDLERYRRRRSALLRQGLPLPLSRFPTDPTTRKGNWAEVLLCEYVVSSSTANLPVYRLRYNPNIEQSMKGDDMLAFDLEADPVRIIVGEAKFRGTSKKEAVIDIVKSLEQSRPGGLPVSLQFAADRLIQEGKESLGQRIEECADLFVRNKLHIDNVGLLASNHLAPIHVQKHAKSSLRRLAVISISLSEGERLVESSFEGLEEIP